MNWGTKGAIPIEAGNDEKAYEFCTQIILKWVVSPHMIKNAELYRGRTYMMSYQPKPGWYWRDDGKQPQ